MVNYDEVDVGKSGAGDKLVEKSSKSWKIVKMFKKLQKSEKICKSHWFEGTFIKILIFHQLNMKNSSFC